MLRKDCDRCVCVCKSVCASVSVSVFLCARAESGRHRDLRKRKAVPTAIYQM